MENKEKKNKHMTLDDRIEIQECLSKGMTFKDIARRIQKDATTVSKEVKLHGKTYSNSFTKTDECCPKLLKAPFVCNGCSKKNHINCPYSRRVYQAKEAQKEYETVLSESREGIPLTKEEFYETEKIISSAGILKSKTSRKASTIPTTKIKTVHVSTNAPKYLPKRIFFIPP